MRAGAYSAVITIEVFQGRTIGKMTTRPIIILDNDEDRSVVVKKLMDGAAAAFVDKCEGNGTSHRYGYPSAETLKYAVLFLALDPQ